MSYSQKTVDRGAGREAVGGKSPGKLFYKIGEVCELTDTQSYVLRFWESEFPQLAPKKSSSGQRVYRRRDIDTVERIKRLLYDHGYTIAGARKRLEQERSGEATALKVEAAVDADVELRGRVMQELQEILRVMGENDRRLG